LDPAPGAVRSTIGRQRAVIVASERVRVVDHPLAFVEFVLTLYGSLPGGKRKHGVCISDHAGHRRCSTWQRWVRLASALGPVPMGRAGLYKEDTGDRRSLWSGVFGLCLDDVGIGAC